MVQYGDENLITIGGVSNGERIDELYKLSCSVGVCTWTEMQQKLKIPRSYLTAIPIPDSMVSCK